jgi:hypothetical protein
MRPWTVMVLLFALGISNTVAQTPPPFSRFGPNTVFEIRTEPASHESTTWVHRPLRGIKSNGVQILAEAETEPVLQFQVSRSASALVYTLRAEDSRQSPNRLLEKPWLCWRWRASVFPVGAVMGEKAGDDFAARVYLMFDYPLEKVPAFDRLGLRMARLLYDASLPAATVVYVLHAGHDPGGFVSSPYTARVKMRSVNAKPSAGQWSRVCRHVPQDFQLAFGAEFGAGVAPLQAIAVGADGDQTSAEFSTEFGDLEWRTTPY